MQLCVSGFLARERERAHLDTCSASVFPQSHACCCAQVQLRELYLENNELSSLPESLGELSSLMHLGFSRASCFGETCTISGG